MTNQLQSDLFEAAERRGRAPQRTIEWFISALEGRDWIRAADVLEIAGMDVNEESKRSVRRLAAGSEGRVGIGPKGYKLVREMTKAEFDTCYNTLLSQSDSMKQRAVDIANVFYGRRSVG